MRDGDLQSLRLELIAERQRLCEELETERRNADFEAARAQKAEDQIGNMRLHAQEMYDVLFRVVRTSVLGGPVGHDLMLKARSIVRRVEPARYKSLLERREIADLPPIPGE